MPNRFTSIEDELDFAQTLVNDLKIKDYYDEINYFEGEHGDLEKIKDLVTKPIPNLDRDVYMIDLKLKTGGKSFGLEFIKLIRKNRPQALIIVHSAHENLRKDSLNAGADAFFIKEHPYTTFMSSFKRLLINFIVLPDHKNDNYQILYGQIMNIDKENNEVKVKCKNSLDINDYFIRFYPLFYFSNINNLIVDQSILIERYEFPGNVIFSFREGTFDYFENEKIDFNDFTELIDSPIFKIN